MNNSLRARIEICFRMGPALAFFFLASSEVRGETPIAAEMSRIGDASHIEFKGHSQWKYDLRREGDRRIRLRIPALDAAALARLKTHSDPLIEKIEVDTNGVDGAMDVVFNVKGADVDFFDYLTDDPSKLIIDFFPKDEKPLKKVDAASAPSPAVGTPGEPGAALRASQTALPQNVPPSQLPPKGGKSSSQIAVETQRKPAGTEFIQTPVKGLGGPAVAADEYDAGGDGPGSGSDLKHGVFDAGDPEFKRFVMPDHAINESAIIASRGNIYLRFPPLRLDQPHLKTLLNNPPIYEVVPIAPTKELASTASGRALLEENKEAQLLLTLFSNNRRAVFLKTARDFLKKRPESRYDEIVRYMMADTYYGLWRDEREPVDFETAMGLYRHLSEKYPQSPLATRTLLLMGYSYVDRGDSFGALKALQRFLRQNDKSKFADQVKISIAEAYLALNRYDDSLSLLDGIEAKAPNRRDAAEAAFRKGDVYFQRKDSAMAIKLYREAVKKYPELAGQFPNAWYNIGEAMFWSGNYKESLEGYREFLKRFPDHIHGGYAMTRVGELLEILGGSDKRALGAYLESQFRYRETPGANVARIRTLVGRMPEMKEKELKNALAEIERLAETTQLPDIKEFTTVAVADGHFRRGEFQRSTDDLIAFYQKNPNATNREKFQTRIERNITENIRTAVERGDFIDALRQNSRFSQSWLKNSDRVDTRYYVGRAYELAGVGKEAAAVYRETLNKLYSIRGSSRERERGVFEVLPETDALNLRLAQVSAREREFAKAETFLNAIASPARLNDREIVERAQVAADVAEARGDVEAAKKHLSELVNTWKGQPSLVSETYLRLAHLHAKTKNFSDAETALAKIINLQKDTGLVADETFAGALELKGDTLLARGKRAESVATFRELLETFEGKRPLSSVRYKTGKILFEDGDFKGAENLWAELKNDSAGIWHKLAQEQLENAKWRGDYKKYIERIPAMAEPKKE